MKIQLTIISPRGVFVGVLKSDQSVSTDQLQDVIDTFEIDINRLLNVTITTDQDQQLIFGQKILEQSVLSFKLV